MRVSRETSYRSLFVQANGALRHELTRGLRTGRARRRAHDRLEWRGAMREMVLISERPAEAADRPSRGAGRAISSSAEER